MATRVHGLRGWLVFAALVACAPTPPSLPAAETGDASSSDAGVDAASGGGGITGGTGAPACEADPDCDDGEFCNGAETCRDGGCVEGESPCTARELCDETLDACEPNCDVDSDGEASIACGGTDCDDDNDAVGSMATEVCDAEDLDEDCDPTTTHEQLLGSWANCSACLDNCGPQSACEDGSCVPARRVFISSTAMDGAFGGAAAADDTCQQLAVDAGLGGSWLAYLVDSDNGLGRHQPADVAYVRMDGVRIADSWVDLTDGGLMAPLNVTESGELATSDGMRPSNAWTGLAQVDGQPPNNCDNWTYTGPGCLEGSPCGAAGEPDAIDDHWDGFFVFQCEQLFRLYCIEQ